MIIKTDRGWKKLQPMRHIVKPPDYVNDLLEDHGLLPDSIQEQYSEAIRRFLLPRTDPEWIPEERMFRVISSKNLVPSI